MNLLETLVAIGACGIAGVLYMAPYLVAVARAAPGLLRVLLVNLCAGWTIVGWLVALRLASRRAPSPSRAAPSVPASGPSGSATYKDGTYLICAAGEARTWAIHADGRWGIAFELEGIQRTASWVDSTDVPLGVLARALRSTSELTS